MTVLAFLAFWAPLGVWGRRAQCGSTGPERAPSRQRRKPSPEPGSARREPAAARAGGKEGAAVSSGPVPIPAVDLVEALTYSAGCRWRVARRPPRWLGGSLQVSGTRPYPLVPPLPVLEDFTTGPPPFRGRRNVAEREEVGQPPAGGVSGCRSTTLSSSPRSSGTVTDSSVGSDWRPSEYAPSVSSWDRTLSATKRAPGSALGLASSK